MGDPDFGFIPISNRDNRTLPLLVPYYKRTRVVPSPCPALQWLPDWARPVVLLACPLRNLALVL